MNIDDLIPTYSITARDKEDEERSTTKKPSQGGIPQRCHRFGFLEARRFGHLTSGEIIPFICLHAIRIASDASITGDHVLYYLLS
jgi:hypothetical protein